MPKNSVITALDVGTKKVTTVVAQLDENNNIKFIGKGVAENQGGMIAGNVVNLEATTKAIRESVEEAEKIAAIRIKPVYIAVSGEQISSRISRGMVSVRGDDVADTDIERVIEEAKVCNLPSDREIVNVEIGEYILDGRGGIRNPKGMAGRKLEVKVLIVTALTTMLRNLAKSVEDAGLQIEDWLVSGIADSWAVLEPDEQKLGVALIDVGEGTTDVAIYHNGDPVYTAVIPMGGKDITNDISKVMKIPPVEAEKIKRRYGNARQEYISESEEIEVTTIGTNEKKSKKVKQLSAVLTPRVEEILIEAKKAIMENQIENLLQTNIVITGGTAELKNIEILAKDIFEQATRIGKPTINEESSGFCDVLGVPDFSTAVGIINYFAARNTMKVKKENFFTTIYKYFRKFFE